ncbi:cupin domain-containing protein [Conexibacter woesei]|uniref:Cupin 2 conserved barrel domain protein n=1 Tax=Conexibacter woesei (strain DSM 14684 / CCUG 47730 / CIP 108061 / JCM 11494 / NBRC 100937 / ID131577) TaxID=469383 RepID=D3FAR6_CONWI|nr:cupin domain-containing protein [Conexibacter woesei]ADB51229.1 Cupin 2 conserved barrel domain protein [Conexibacter woesei DSM 14684]
MDPAAVTREQMESTRVARFAALDAWTIQDDPIVPQEARDIFLARRLRTVATPAGLEGPFANPSPITDVEGFSLNIAICPPGQGPGLHRHRQTTETFTCLRGRFRVYYGEHGEHETFLDELDTISIPPGVMRGFQNVGDADGHLQVLITGDVRDMNDITLAPSVLEAIAAFGPEVAAAVEATGRTPPVVAAN